MAVQSLFNMATRTVCMNIRQDEWEQYLLLVDCIPPRMVEVIKDELKRKFYFVVYHAFHNPFYPERYCPNCYEKEDLSDLNCLERRCCFSVPTSLTFQQHKFMSEHRCICCSVMLHTLNRFK